MRNLLANRPENGHLELFDLLNYFQDDFALSTGKRIYPKNRLGVNPSNGIKDG